MIHKFSITPEADLTLNDTAFMVTIWLTNLYGSYTFRRVGHTTGTVMLFMRSSLLVAARGSQILRS